jgi:hypothetical protein
MTVMRANQHLVGAALLLLAGCADLSPAWVVIGDGQDQHTGLLDGDDVPIVQGLQGGHMVALSLGAGGVLAGDPTDPTDPRNPRVTFQAFLAEEPDPLGSITVVRGLSPMDDGDLQLLGTWLIFDAALDTSVYFDQVIDLEVRITDSRGTEATDSVSVTSTWTPAR